jgi:predicted hydrocarbon binding protein
MANQDIVNAFLGTLAFDKQTSQLGLGGAAVAFHCDKFNTRILKNFEDVIGYEGGGELLFRMAERTTYSALERFLCAGPAASVFGALDLRGRLEAIFELFKALAYGAVEIVELSPEKARFTSKTSYLAEGWLENKSRWNLDEREGPACHDIRGHLAAAMALSTGKPQGSYRTRETQCRAYKNATICEFVVEVK